MPTNHERSLVLAVVLLASLPAARAGATPEPMTRDEIITYAQSGVGYSYYWGHGSWRWDGADPGSCYGSCPDCTHSGSYGADCSGFAGKVWQVPSPSALEVNTHPYSTYNFRNETTHWSQVPRADLLKGDALVYNSSGAGHIVVYESGDGWGSFWAYECKGCSYGCVHNLRTASSSYIGIRRDSVLDTPPNIVPAGYLDQAGCETVSGWAQDPDAADSAIDVHVYFGGPAGDPAAVATAVSASQYREDLCGAIGSCAHGFQVRSPLSLQDGQPHAVYAYGIDSAGGPNTLLGQSPLTLTCSTVPPAGVLRHIPDQDTMTRWGFTYFWDVLPVDDATLAGRETWQPVPAQPLLVQADDGTPEVWLIDGPWRRHVPSPEVAARWGLVLATVQVWPAADVAGHVVGTPLRDRPVLVKGSGPAVYLLDDRQIAATGTAPDEQLALPAGAAFSGQWSAGCSVGAVSAGTPPYGLPLVLLGVFAWPLVVRRRR